MHITSTNLSRRIALVAFIGGLGGGLVFPILPALGFKLGISGFMIGLILSANRISRLLFDGPAGRAIQRLGASQTLAGALLIETVGVLGYSAALHFGHAQWWLLGGRAVYGIGSAFLFVGSQAAVLSLSNRDDRGKKTASVRVAIGAAIPSGLILGGVLADLFSDDFAFLTGAAVTLAGAILAWIIIPRPPATRKQDRVLPRQESSFRALLHSEHLVFLISAWGFNTLIFLVVQGVLLATMVVLIERRQLFLFGLHAQGTSGLVMAVVMGCAALMAFVLGRAIDVVKSRSAFLIPSLIGLASGFAVLALARTIDMTLLGAVLIGLSYNGVTLPTLALLGDAVSLQEHGPAVGVYQIFGDVGGIIGPIVGLELGMHIGLQPLYLLMAALPAMSVVVAWRLQRYERALHHAQSTRRDHGPNGKRFPIEPVKKQTVNASRSPTDTDEP